MKVLNILFRTNKFSTRGFTILEMVVVTAIIGVLSAVVIAQQKNFNNSTVLINTAYDLALSLRETQSLGLSSKNYSSTGTNNAGYGIYIGNSASSYIQYVDSYPGVGSESTINNTQTLGTYYCPHSASDVGTPAERPGNCLYDSAQSEKIMTYSLAPGYSIQKIYYLPGSPAPWTSFTSGGSNVLNIVFQRPNLLPIMNVNIFGTNKWTSAAAIQIQSSGGVSKCIDINQLGEITIANTVSGGCTQPS